jgi:uncharacterized protein (DUF3084 family)
MNKQTILDKIKVAQQELRDAEADVGKALSELKVAVRADKSIIGTALEAAFAKVKLANQDLGDLEKLIESVLD